MLYIKTKTLFNDLAVDPSVAKLKLFFVERRLSEIERLKSMVAAREEKTGFTNYSAHVLDAATYYGMGLKKYCQLDADRALDGITIADKMYMQGVVYQTASVSVRSAFAAVRQYNNRNIVSHKMHNSIKAIKRYLNI